MQQKSRKHPGAPLMIETNFRRNLLKIWKYFTFLLLLPVNRRKFYKNIVHENFPKFRIKRFSSRKNSKDLPTIPKLLLILLMDYPSPTIWKVINKTMAPSDSNWRKLMDPTYYSDIKGLYIHLPLFPEPA